MLKVVGASIAQTRVSSYILAALALCGIFIIIFGGNMASTDDNDGIYSATVYWKSTLGYRIEFWGQGNSLNEIPKGSARAYYKPDFYANGWSKLEIETNTWDPDWVQAYSAGLLEGSLTWQLIYWHWQNTIQVLCEHHESECALVRDYIRINSEAMRARSIQYSETDKFWHHVRLYYAQLDGMEIGWRYAVKRSRQSYDISTEDFLWMNIAADLPDMVYKLNLSFDELFKEPPNLSSAIFKLTNVSSDPAVHVGHSTGGSYRSMLRTVKRYNFNFHETASPKSKLVNGTVLTFSSYPGVISSQDDFYIINSKQKEEHSLAVTGTPINHIKVNLWNKFKAEEQVLTSVRVMVANRLASDGRSWSRYFSHSNSGTDNKQWVILNKRKLVQEPWKKPGRAEGLLWVLEQVPGLIHSSDQSHTLHKDGYWASFGLAHYEDVRNAINLVDPEYKDVMNSNLESPRAKVFDECRTKCNSLDNVLHLLRHGINPATNTYGARGDLYSENPKAYGIIDSKLFTGTPNKTLDFQILSGPVFTSSNQVEVKEDNNEIDATLDSNEVVPPFKWSSSKFKDVPHVGQPDVWNFTPFRPNWVWI